MFITKIVVTFYHVLQDRHAQLNFPLSSLSCFWHERNLGGSKIKFSVGTHKYTYEPCNPGNIACLYSKERHYGERVL